MLRHGEHELNRIMSYVIGLIRAARAGAGARVAGHLLYRKS